MDWVVDMNFGGVEIAFVYPLENCEPGVEWLSSKWTELVTFAKKYCDSIGLTCDFTLGTLWPFGGSIVSEGDASRTFDGVSPQRLRKSWEARDKMPGYILNHLDRKALRRYCHQMQLALKPALEGSKSGLFCDSWEVETEGLWSEGMDDVFENKFGYDLGPYKNRLDEYPHVRYDYRKLISDYVLKQFYKPYNKYCNQMGGFSRVQCHGAPVDILAAYASVDVPETESILFDPPFSTFAASAAAISGAEIVSSETFTCLYGWKPHPGPPPYLKREQIADMKLLADAMLANGTNLIVWHGMPYNPPGGSNEFYATTQVGRDSGFVDELQEFNSYLADVGECMSFGKTYTDVAVYLPLEDNWMRNRLPDNKKRPSANYHWELQYVKFPEELRGYHPLWISAELLKMSHYANNKLICGKAEFNSLYIDVEWLDEEALDEILRLASCGLPVFIKRFPKNPGFRAKSQYDRKVYELVSLDNVTDFIRSDPVVEGDNIPEFWLRVTDDDAMIFFANPKSKELRYPMKYGQSFCEETEEVMVKINLFGKKIQKVLIFLPYRSICLNLFKDAKISYTEKDFVPSIPLRESGE